MDDEEGNEWEDGGGDDDLALLGIEDDEAPVISTAGVDWAEAGLKAAEKVSSRMLIRRMHRSPNVDSKNITSGGGASSRLKHLAPHLTKVNMHPRESIFINQSMTTSHEEVLATPAMQGIEIYTFRPVVQSKKLVIRLDKLSDRYGSPSIDDIEK
eukprot:366130-Chlamydomonas_euryale.AAC.59